MQPFNFTGKTALITGASSGLGEQFARCLSGVGATVILAARRVDRLQKLALEIENAIPLEMDVSNKASVQAAFEKLANKGCKIDICINNAGTGKPTPIFEPDPHGEFEATIQTNVMGVWYVTKAVVNHMREHQIHGSVINIGSINGANRLSENIAGYCASKAAIMQMTKALTGELARANIRINCIVPGLFHTARTQERLNTEVNRKKIEGMIPLNFVAEPQELDGAILYLASNASRYVTGSCLTCDGGISWGG